VSEREVSNEAPRPRQRYWDRQAPSCYSPQDGATLPSARLAWFGLCCRNLSATYRGKIRSWTRSRHSRSPIGRGPARQVSKAARSACSRPAKSYFFPICASSSATRRPTAGPPLLGWQGQEHQFRSRRRRAAGHVAHERGRRCASATSAAFLPPMPYPPEWALPGLRALAPAGPRELPAGAGRSAVDLLPER